MAPFNIYMTGVGGQGIGLLSEVLLRAADHAGLKVKSVDTHGLAQRGGIVVSQLRIGPQAHAPLIASHDAHLVVALERHEALRAAAAALKPGGTLIYYDTVWQPLPVRLKQATETTAKKVEKMCNQRQARLIRIHHPTLKDARMQNIVILANIRKHRLIADLEAKHFHQAMTDLMAGAMLKKNMDLFDTECVAA